MAQEHLDTVDELVDAYRDRCLWFLRSDYYPVSREEKLRALDYIARYGDLDAYRKATVLKRWLLGDSSAASVK